MNKTSYKSNNLRKRELQTQTNFRRNTPQSPFRSQKSFEEANLKCDPLRLEMQIAKQYGKG
jgi:hypothetical protein